ncbi:PREDICTED: insulin-degrading enzyme-like 1, peroxisomal [Ipomoea nil]|uniref:insulin-degrading enzyme-like 1, peroxisomal n=1 Tax=Ipomoea nil TaxID=35883 RepID=UPI0009012B04|nr:PREDICTED: insulin-degrading enzyme-like 1, peroxisomal [Ipomoea nil]
MGTNAIRSAVLPVHSCILNTEKGLSWHVGWRRIVLLILLPFGHTDTSEPWYGTAYSLEKIDGSLIQKWMDEAPVEDLHLPAPNVFIPTDLSLKHVLEKTKLPSLLRKSPYSRLWYKPDATFSSPKAYVKIDFNCPYSGASPESELLTDVFTRLLMAYLNEYAYHAQVAGLYYT